VERSWENSVYTSCLPLVERKLREKLHDLPVPGRPPAPSVSAEYCHSNDSQDVSESFPFLHDVVPIDPPKRVLLSWLFQPGQSEHFHVELEHHGPRPCVVPELAPSTGSAVD
jgi:hypothetical protein